jgi:hypothetical protein
MTVNFAGDIPHFIFVWARLNLKPPLPVVSPYRPRLVKFTLIELVARRQCGGERVTIEEE